MKERFDVVREQIARNDEEIVAAVNRRIALVTELWQLKRELGLATVDRERERLLRERLVSSSAGPLTPAGVDTVITMLLELTKSELDGT